MDWPDIQKGFIHFIKVVKLCWRKGGGEHLLYCAGMYITLHHATLTIISSGQASSFLGH